VSAKEPRLLIKELQRMFGENKLLLRASGASFVKGDKNKTRFDIVIYKVQRSFFASRARSLRLTACWSQVLACDGVPLPSDKELYAVMSSKIAGDWAEYRAACRCAALQIIREFLIFLCLVVMICSITTAAAATRALISTLCDAADDAPSGNSFGSYEGWPIVFCKCMLFHYSLLHILCLSPTHLFEAAEEFCNLRSRRTEQLGQLYTQARQLSWPNPTNSFGQRRQTVAAKHRQTKPIRTCSTCGMQRAFNGILCVMHHLG
jgi:hypothetical protein